MAVSRMRNEEYAV